MQRFLCRVARRLSGGLRGIGPGAAAMVVAMVLSAGALAANIDLQVSSYTWTPDPVVNGGTVTFTLSVQNNGPATSAAGTLSITPPGNVDYAGNASGCSYSAPVLSCPIPALAMGATASVTYTATGNGAGVQSTSASIAESPLVNADTNAANDTLPKNVTSIKGADLTIAKTGPASATAGSTISFSLATGNNGPDSAALFRVTDNLPAGSDFSFQSAGGAGWSCAHAGTTVTCDYSGAAVPALGSAPDITVTGQIITSAGSITNGASVVSTDSGTGDPDAGNNGPSQWVVSVTAGTNLRANKTMVSSSTGLTTLVNGEAVTLTLSATNTGTQQATGVTVSDSVPADFAIGTLPAPCSRLGQDISCTVGTLNAGATSAAFVIPLSVTGSAGSSGSNTALVARSTPVAGTDTPASSNYSIVVPFAHLTVSKTKVAQADESPGGSDPVRTGQNIVNTVLVSNSSSSTSAATGTVTVEETLLDYPDESYGALDPASATAGWACVDGGATVTCTYAIATSLARGATLPALVFTTVANGAAMNLSNQVCTGGNVSGHVPPDDDSVPDCSGVQTLYSAPADVDIGLTKSVDDNSIATNETGFIYTIQVTNHSGTDTAPTIVVTDAIPMYYTGPAGSTGVVPTLVGAGAGEGCSGTGTVTCTIKNLAPGQTRTITLQVARPVLDGTNITNTVTWDSPDVVQTVNLQPDSASVDVSIAPIADVTVTAIADAPDPDKIGVELTYTTSIDNNGPSSAQGVVLRHVVDPARMSYVAGSAVLTGGGSCVHTTFVGGSYYAGQQGIECTGFSLANDESRQLTFKVLPVYPYPDATPATYTSVAAITTTTVESDAPGYANNAASNDAHIVVDELDLAVTKQETLGYDPDGAGPLGNLLHDPIAFGDQIKYLVVLRNNGPSLATAVSLSDVMTPPGGYAASYNSAVLSPADSNYTPAALTCTGSATGGDPLLCYLGTGAGDSFLPAGKYVGITVTFTPTGPDPAGSLTYSNQATVASAETGAGHDSLPGNNVILENTTVLPRTDLYLTKAASAGTDGDGSPYNINETFNYVLTVGNLGTSDAAGVRVADSLPTGFVANGNVTVTPGANVTLLTNTCGGSAWTGSCDLGPIPQDVASNPANQVVITIPVRAAYPFAGPYGSDISNSASVAPIDGTSIDPNPSNNTGTANVQVQRSSIAGQVYGDNDLDDTVDSGEGINSVVVTLTGTDAYGYTYCASACNNAALTRTTAGSGASAGSFLFDNLPPGTWTLAEANPANTWDRLEWAGTAGGTTPGNTCDGVQNCSAGAAHNRISAISLPGATAATGYLFQEYRRAQLSGYVYSDANNDGDRGAEAGIASLGGHITLSGLAYNGVDVCTLVTCTVSLNGSGQFSYANLPPSSTGYSLQQNSQPAGYLDGKEQTGDGTGSVVAGSAGRQPLGVGGNTNTETIAGVLLNPNQSKTEHNFGELLPATLGGYVFVDYDSDAVRDVAPAETSGLPGIQVQLTGSDDLGNPVNTTLATTGAGSYSFVGLRPGSYTVTQVDAPAGLTHTGAQAGSKGGDIDGATRTAGTGVPGAAIYAISAIGLIAADNATGYNFGESGQGLSGYVYADLDNDGVKDAGEPGIPGVQVDLSGLTSGGADVCLVILPSPCTATTDANGAYAFPGLPLSDGTGYTLSEQLQADAPLANYADGLDTAGSLGGDNGVDDVLSGIKLVNAGDFGADYNFGEIGATLAGQVYHDVDDDGTRNAGDSGIEAVTLTLSGTTASGDDVCTVLPACTTTSAADGSFRFAGLPASDAGGYTVAESQPQDYLSRTDTVGHDDLVPGTPVGSAGSDQFTAIVIGVGSDFSGYLFGEKTGEIAGRVFVDADNDGVMDAGEPGIGGVTLTLSGTTASGADICVSGCPTIVTDGAGAYVFGGVRNADAGGYTVTESQPAAYLDGKTAQGRVDSATCAACDNSVANVIAAIPFAVAGVYSEFDFGELLAASLAGTVYIDNNGSATLDVGEPYRLEGIAVALAGTDDLGAAVSLNTVTDAAGNYGFSGLRPGSYGVTETKPAWITATGASVGSQGGTAGGDATTQYVHNVSIPPAATAVAATGYDFGHLGTASLSGYVYVDLNDNGSKDVGELGIPGVAVTLSGNTGGGSPVCGYLPSCVATTAADGYYAFSQLPASDAGGYVLSEQSQASPPLDNFADGSDTPGSGSSAAGVASGDVFTGIVLAAGQDATYYLFGELGAVVEGTVYQDDDGSGLRNGLEPVLPGVSVRVHLSTGDNLTLTTDANGWFGSPVPPGTTVVDVDEASLPANLALTSNVYGEGNDPTALDVPLGGSSADNNGYILVSQFGAVDGRVYQDNNGNGVYDPGTDTPFPGVTVHVTTRTGGLVILATDADGLFGATVPAGETRVDVVEATLPSSQLALTSNASNEGSDVSIVSVPVNGSATDNTGYVVQAQFGRVEGVVYQDNDGNGLYDAGTDTPYENVRVAVTTSSGGVVLLFSNAGGQFGADVPPGLTRVDVVESSLPAGVVLTTDSHGEGNDASGVTVPANGVGVDNNGYVVAQTGYVEGVVYHDRDRDGLYTPGIDQPFAGIPVRVTTSTGGVVWLDTDSGGHVGAPVPAGATGIDVVREGTPVMALALTHDGHNEGSDPSTVMVPVDGVAADNTGYVTPQGIPTVSGWGLMLLAGLLALSAGLSLRRRMIA